MELNQKPHTIEIADQQSAKFDADPLIAAIQMIADDHQVSRSEISVAIVDDPTIRKLNQQYLQHDYETDVISFVLDWNEDTGSLSGQLIVSTDTAATLADDVGSTMQEELLLYVIHGMLHLVGYDDKQPAAALEMRAAEKEYLSRFNIQHRGFNNDSANQTTPRHR
ncbi:rRNA maturation RNase YbeY [Mariniblastus sp.]|nr:rRNA maturation RNase YbeY [Mariniblastus sp.]